MTHASTHDLDELADRLIGEAGQSSSGRAAETLFGGSGHRLRQTVIALVADAELSEHENPGEATLHVLRGQVELTAGEDRTSLGAGHVAVIPDRRHALRAVRDSAVLLTVAK